MIRRKGLRTLIKNDWKKVLKFEFDKPYFLKLEQFLLDERRLETVYPPSDKVFNAFNLCSFHNLKVVIIGQDPYHNPDEAHGLCFSVPEGVKQPPSLRNILKELNSDLGVERKSGNLEGWAKQGVLLLNTFLTVRENEPMSHQYSGWHIFTDNVISLISSIKDDIIFILWGKPAQQKIRIIAERHHVLTAVHPSPLSAHRGFFGCKHFSKTNELLNKLNKQQIDWGL